MMKTDGAGVAELADAQDLGAKTRFWQVLHDQYKALRIKGLKLALIDVRRRRMSGIGHRLVTRFFKSLESL